MVAAWESLKDLAALWNVGMGQTAGQPSFSYAGQLYRQQQTANGVIWLEPIGLWELTRQN